MYASRTTQFIVGLFALAGLAALAFLSLRLGRVELLPPPSYQLYANFDNVSGLKDGDSVEIAGVSVGKVQSISLLDSVRAHVSLRINQGVQIDDDAIASVLTRGIIGDQYIAIAPGPGEKMLANGQTIRQTESAFILQNAIGQLINNIGTGGSGGGKSNGSKGNGGGDQLNIDGPGAGGKKAH